MNNKPSIHNYEQRLEQCKALVERSTIPLACKERILAFDMYLAARGITLARRTKYLEVLRTIAMRLNKPFLDVAEQDMQNFVGDIETRQYSPWTKKTYRAIIKRFWKWLKGKDRKYPKEVAWIKTTLSRSKRPLPRAEDLLTEQDVSCMIEHATRPRDRALVSLFWETGARVSELGNLTTQDVQFDKYGAVLHVDGKTGPRRVRIIQSVPHLANWLQLHPLRGKQGAPLWVTTSNSCRGKTLNYTSIRELLREIAKLAGVTKRVNPHAFRHARSTFLAKHLTEFQMNNYLGWTQGSDMPSTYVHLSGRETDDALLRLNGIKPEQQGRDEDLLKPQVCPRCTSINTHDITFCRKCGAALNLRESMEAEQRTRRQEEVFSDVLDDAEVRRAIHQALLKRKVETPWALTQVKAPVKNASEVAASER
jgi:integrase/ribosomal protein L40E